LAVVAVPFLSAERAGQQLSRPPGGLFAKSLHLAIDLVAIHAFFVKSALQTVLQR
jgi:hypothetical protein